MTIQQPYVLFLGDAPDPLAAKVAQGIKDWRPGISVGQITLPGCKADMGLKNISIKVMFIKLTILSQWNINLILDPLLIYI